MTAVLPWPNGHNDLFEMAPARAGAGNAVSPCAGGHSEEQGSATTVGNFHLRR